MELSVNSVYGGPIARVQSVFGWSGLKKTNFDWEKIISTGQNWKTIWTIDCAKGRADEILQSREELIHDSSVNKFLSSN